MPVPFFDLKRQITKIKPDLLQAIDACIDSGTFILGPKVVELEKAFQEIIGVKHAVGVASGTDALHLSLKAIDVQQGDEVITSPFTFVATAQSIIYCGAKPVFADIEPNTFNLDPLIIEPLITKKTKAIIPVHLYGLPANLDNIIAICEKNKISLIEDCAQAIGARCRNKSVGSFGSAGCFSFFPTKNLGCFGDGGIITTNDSSIYENLLSLRGHGSKKTYFYDSIGYNSRLDGIQATILLVRLNYLDGWTNKRRKNAALYHSHLSSVKELILPVETPNTMHVYNQFTIRAQDRDSLFEFLKKSEIGAMVYYPLSLHLQKSLSYLGYKIGDFPNAEKAQSEVLSLPIFPELEEKEIETVCSFIKKFYGQT
ncbi:MAG: DegT/DnrJ/EryC1/StrS aminotransferase [Candidatus Saganbacteria bacterium]|uniref:DegT/DnrJ/EryC1/StrS aminotransferase n=1 Tax=Candidatus Saganbacteria bacterium TaxID=2575572 RepID=A0A833L0T2_UNCSA|nr:MAG: DegT/DnrJ/EryC1/StrS aminotransferase [Candidatus Saganbacteria bacterium]